MLGEGRVYEPLTVLSEDSVHATRLGPTGGQIIMSSHGRNFLTGYSEKGFHGANPGAAGIVTTVALATTYTGLCLSNPIGSNVLVLINHVDAAFSVVFPAAAHIGLMVGYHATTDVVHTNALSPRNDKVGVGAGPKAKLDDQATLPVAPTVKSIFGAVVASAAGYFDESYDSGLQLPSGAFAAIYTSTISGAAALMGSFDWEEIRLA